MQYISSHIHHNIIMYIFHIRTKFLCYIHCSESLQVPVINGFYAAAVYHS